MLESAERVLTELCGMSNEENVAGMARFGINPKNTLGIPMPVLRKIAKREGHCHALAQALWSSRVHEARILAALVDDPGAVTTEQMERWVAEFDSWDVCDQVCMNLFDKTPFAYAKAAEWARREEEFVKRAGFALMASLASHDKTATDERFEAFLPLIAEGARDGRNFVKKAVDWALRGIGKRDAALNASAAALAEELCDSADKNVRWVGRTSLRELTSEAVRTRLGLSVP